MSGKNENAARVYVAPRQEVGDPTTRRGAPYESANLTRKEGLCAHEFVTAIRHNVPQSHFKRSAAARTCASLGGTAEPRGSREFWKSTIQPGYSDESALA